VVKMSRYQLQLQNDVRARNIINAGL